MVTVALVFIHVLTATIWIGAHAAHPAGPLKAALANRDPKPTFEKNYGRLAMASPAAATGIHTALERYPPAEWFNIANPSGVVGLKIARRNSHGTTRTDTSNPSHEERRGGVEVHGHTRRRSHGTLHTVHSARRHDSDWPWDTNLYQRPPIYTS